MQKHVERQESTQYVWFYVVRDYFKHNTVYIHCPMSIVDGGWVFWSM